MDTETIDAETGELTIGQRATSAAVNGRVKLEAMRRNENIISLNHAVELALNNGIPIWVQATSSAKITDRVTRKYASLKDILEAVRPPLLKYGVLIRQGLERSYSADEGGGMKGRVYLVYTDLVHVASGEVCRTLVEIPVTKLDPQAAGSALTYGKRYSLIAALGLATDEADDDGARAMPSDLTQELHETIDLQRLKAEIDKMKSPTDLAEWSHDAKTRARINKLSEAETVMLRAHFKARGEALVSDGAQ